MLQSEETAELKATIETTSGISAVSSTGTCYQSLQPDTYHDTLLVRTTLGRRLTNNPYSVANMQQASRNLYGNATGISLNKKYVRFKPSNESQLQQLTALNLDLFDYPLDYEVTQQGDFYDQGLPVTETPWLYTVVDPTFTPPSGIQYQLLSDLHVPPTNVYLENEAFRITGNPVEPLDCGGTTTNNTGSSPDAITNDVDPCIEGHWDPVLQRCVLCPEGSNWDGIQCVPGSITPTPPPASTRPSGQIMVRDNAIAVASPAAADVPVRRTRVVLKRWFKIDRVFTDDNGNFASGKNFRKVEIRVEFMNNGLTAIRLTVRPMAYLMYLPIERTLGKYSGNLTGVRHVFDLGTDVTSRRYRNWWAAQLVNSYQEYNEMAAALGTGGLPSNMLIMLTRLPWAAGTGSTPMNKHRILTSGTIPRDWIAFFVADPLRAQHTAIFNFLIQGALLRTLDMTLGYNVNLGWTSDRVKALMYHELSHAAHFNKVGAAWWNSFVYATETTIVRHTGANDPYGNGTDGISSEYISVGESWAEHMARTMCDRQYGTNSRPFPDVAGNIYQNGTVSFNNQNGTTTRLSSHLSYLELYDPNRAANPFRWIPEGIFYDLIDTRNEPSPVLDGVSNTTVRFTNAQIWNALDADIRSMPQYRDRLIGENPNNQIAQVRALFAEYNYP